MILVAPSIGLAGAEEEERDELGRLDEELGRLAEELGRPEELERLDEELGLPVVRGDMRLLLEPEEPKPVLLPPIPPLPPPPESRWEVVVLKLVGLSVKLLITVATSAASAYLMSIIANSSSVGASTSICSIISIMRLTFTA